MEKFYITSSIPYVNASPHIGHALEYTQTDVIARYQSLLGKEVTLGTGTDENSLKNVRAAELRHISTAQLCAENSQVFRNLLKSMNILKGPFVRSSVKEEHWSGVYKLWEACKKNGDIYSKKYRGLYCVGCEAFYTEGELIDGKCPNHNTRPDEVEEENYFFRLSRYQEKIEEIIKSGEYMILPQERKNEILSFIDSGLEDFSISRSVSRAHGWGIPIPGDQGQIFYVWFDALAVYLTSAGYGKNEEEFGKIWPADVHVIGKDIIRFHAVYWPAMLLSAGLALPKRLFVHGFLTVEGKKMSKSLGNVISPFEIMDKYGADGMRYYLIRDISTFEDGNFSQEGIRDRYNKELVGDLGNLVNRVLTIAEKSGISVFEGKAELAEDLHLDDILRDMDKGNLHEALERIMEFVRSCNAYVNMKEPWKKSGSELGSILYNLLEALRISAILLYPFIPETAEKISAKIGIDAGTFKIKDCSFKERFEGSLSRGGLLFRKIE